MGFKWLQNGVHSMLLKKEKKSCEGHFEKLSHTASSPYKFPFSRPQQLKTERREFHNVLTTAKVIQTFQLKLTPGVIKIESRIHFTGTEYDEIKLSCDLLSVKFAGWPW